MHLFKLFTFLYCSVIGAASPQPSQQPTQLPPLTPQQYPPESTVLVFDCHGVITIVDRRQVALSLPRSLLQVGQTIWNEFSWKNCLSWTEWKEWLRHAHKQRLCENTVAAIEQARNAGYKTCLFSNIGPQSLTILKKEYPAIKAIFPLIVTPGDVCNPDGSLATKSDPVFYTSCAQNIQAHYPNVEIIILFDDKKGNCARAESTTTHNAFTGEKTTWRAFHITDSDGQVPALLAHLTEPPTDHLSSS